jgi:predicted dehydrogenase
MKQAVRKGLKEIIVEEIADPTVKPHHVLVRPFYSLISAGTETADIHTDSLVKEVAENPSHVQKVLDVMLKTDPVSTFHEVRAKFNEYAALGYAGAGIVIEKHATVTDLQIGQRVAYGGEGTGHAETIITGRNLVARVPDNVELDDAAFTTLGSIAMNAVRQAEISVGETVAVIGLGLVGQLVAQIARCQGAIVIAVDLMAERIEMAKATGADFGFPGGNAVEEIKAITEGRGADSVIVAAAAKTAAPLKQAAAICRDRGKIVVVGACPMELPRDAMYIKEIELRMARAYGPGSYDAAYEKGGQDYPLAYVRWTENRNMEEFLRLLAADKVSVKPLVSHTFALSEAPRAYNTILDSSVKSLAVLLKYPAAGAPDAVAAYKPQRRVEIFTKNSSAKKDALNFALVGAGNLAKWSHLPSLQKIAGAELRAVFSASGVRGKSYGKRFGAVYNTTEFEEILKDERVDVVLIASRHREHAEQTVAALHAGKHVFVEKPMAITEAECREIYRAVEESGKHLTVGFNRRYAPFYVEMKNLLKNRTAPAAVNVRMNSPGMNSRTFWAAEPEHGGAIIGEACHFIDLMSWLLNAEPVAVSAVSMPSDVQEPIGENNIAASFRFDDGSIGNLTYCTVGSAATGGELVEVFAPGVGASVEDFKKLIVKKSHRKTKSRMFAEKGYFAQMAEFVADLRSGKNPAVTARDGARATIGALRILESARTGKARDFNLDATLASEF